MARNRKKNANSTDSIAVSGDGIAAEAMALALAQSGRAVVLVGKGSTATSGLQLAPNGWAALEHLGVAEQVSGGSVALACLRILPSKKNIPLCTIPLNDRPQRTPYTSVMRGVLIKALADAGDRSGRISRINARLSTIELAPDGVALTLDTGERIKAGWLIGCDGAQGVSRGFVEAGGGRKPLTLSTAVRCVIPAAAQTHIPGGYATSIWLGSDGGHIVHYPLADGSINLVVVTPDNARKTAQKLLAKTLLEDQPLLAPFVPMLARAKPIAIKDYAVLDTWQRGRVILAGDAAHPMPPHLAQGSGQALIDASLLAQFLDKESDLQAVFSAWSVRRIKTLRPITSASKKIGVLLALGGVRGRLRAIGLGLGGDSILAAELDRLWGDSP